MMRCLLVVLCLASVAFGASWMHRSHGKPVGSNITVFSGEPDVLCKDCVVFCTLVLTGHQCPKEEKPFFFSSPFFLTQPHAVEENLNNLLNIILQVGVPTGCGDICGLLPSKPVQDICEVLCLVEGVKGFINALNNDDLDPVWMCVRLHSCPVNSCTTGCTEVVSVKANPGAGPLRSKFTCMFLQFVSSFCFSLTVCVCVCFS